MGVCRSICVGLFTYFHVSIGDWVTLMYKVRTRYISQEGDPPIYAKLAKQGYVNPKLAVSRRWAGLRTRIRNGNLTPDLKQRRCTTCHKWFNVRDPQIKYGTCIGCNQERYISRVEGTTHYIDCAWCGKPIRRAPYCDEHCRKELEKYVKEQL